MWRIHQSFGYFHRKIDSCLFSAQISRVFLRVIGLHNCIVGVSSGATVLFIKEETKPKLLKRNVVQNVFEEKEQTDVRFKCCLQRKSDCSWLHHRDRARSYFCLVVHCVFLGPLSMSPSFTRILSDSQQFQMLSLSQKQICEKNPCFNIFFLA